MSDDLAEVFGGNNKLLIAAYKQSELVVKNSKDGKVNGKVINENGKHPKGLLHGLYHGDLTWSAIHSKHGDILFYNDPPAVLRRQFEVEVLEAITAPAQAKTTTKTRRL